MLQIFVSTQETHAEAVSEFLTSLVEGHLAALEEDGCIELGEDEAGGDVIPTTLGRIASFYYLQHATAGHLCRKMHGSMGARELLEVGGYQQPCHWRRLEHVKCVPNFELRVLG